MSGGPAPDAAEVGPLPAGAFVIAADSGLEHAAALGLSVDVLVGDLDSASPQAVSAAEAAGVRVERHPVAKDATDLELALEYALAAGATRVTVISGGGGERLDHHLAELVLLAAARFAPLRLDARIGTARAVAIHAGDDVSLTGRPGAVLSLIALGGPATGLTTTGVRWPLTADTLEPGSTRGRQQRDPLEPGARAAPTTAACWPSARTRSSAISRGGRRRRSRSGPGC